MIEKEIKFKIITVVIINIISQDLLALNSIVSCPFIGPLLCSQKFEANRLILICVRI